VVSLRWICYCYWIVSLDGLFLLWNGWNCVPPPLELDYYAMPPKFKRPPAQEVADAKQMTVEDDDTFYVRNKAGWKGIKAENISACCGFESFQHETHQSKRLRMEMDYLNHSLHE